MEQVPACLPRYHLAAQHEPKNCEYTKSLRFDPAKNRALRPSLRKRIPLNLFHHNGHGFDLFGLIAGFAN